ncbi:MAG: hypothetical protein ACM3US_01640 [Sphingomonadaceae bacterium]
MDAQIELRASIPRLRRLVASLAFAANALLFGPFYLPGALETLHRHVAIDPMSPAMLSVVFGVFFHSIFFSQPGRYLLLSAMGVGLLVAALLLARPGRTARLLLSLTLLGVLAVPWVYRYQPALSAAPGYRVLVATQPGLLEGATKRAQVAAEHRPCDYSLLGWSADDALYYQEGCRGGAPRIMAIAPGREEQPRVVERVPPDISAESKLSAASLVRSNSRVFGPDGRLLESAEAERSRIRIKLREGGLESPDGRWVAIVARHIYGPEDVLILSKDEDGA